jgi:hypothetical protein
MPQLPTTVPGETSYTREQYQPPKPPYDGPTGNPKAGDWVALGAFFVPVLLVAVWLGLRMRRRRLRQAQSAPAPLPVARARITDTDGIDPT